MTAKEREHAFMIGAPLAIVPALAFLPAVMFPDYLSAHALRSDRLERSSCHCAPSPVASDYGSLPSAQSRSRWGIFNVLSFATLLVLAGHRRLYGTVFGA